MTDYIDPKDYQLNVDLTFSAQIGVEHRSFDNSLNLGANNISTNSINSAVVKKSREITKDIQKNKERARHVLEDISEAQELKVEDLGTKNSIEMAKEL
eukprot:CAMPEP_0116890188 /NCGR_PEP_ID=MMETSP0467-20121206/725_1 /TAXON_ID=283647 /ORGANISM="Mesodinium pulex, Strain SPMC105" /LENGTH=97 /DNA_ID=CAMNT_0004557695 /DNA_START=2551 /DNA_END=2844 /DNA_ORIENTATION=-